MSTTSPTEIDDLRELLEKADDAYYNNDDPILDDSDYDNLVKYWNTLTGKTWMKMGKPSPLLTRIPHVVPMLSLFKNLSMADLAKWIPVPGIFYVLSPKIDGCSIEIRYVKGRFTQALSRGDGTYGEDITLAVRALVKGGHVPAVIDTTEENVHIRGEGYIPPTLFPFVGGKNPRNSAAGLLRRQSEDSKQKHLRFCAYRILNSSVSYETDLLGLSAWEFETPPFVVLTDKDLLDMTPESLHPNDWAGELPYEIDGVVIAINEPDHREELGETSSYPRWACAYKFETAETETVIVAVDWTANRTGTVVPTYIFEAVELCGTTVTRATGHNFDQFNKLGAGPGTRVVVKKCNEIIPRVERLAPGQDPHDAMHTLPPSTCPTCETALVIKSVHLICPSPLCKEKLIGQIENAGKRDNLDINGLGESVCEALVASGLVDSLADIFTLDVKDLTAMPYGKTTYGAVRAAKLHTAIAGAKTKPWNLVLHALGCPGLGQPECDAIAARYSLEQLGSMAPVQLKMELIGMRGIGEVTAVTFVEWLRANYKWVFDIIDVLQTEPKKVDTKAQKLLGYTIVLTGSFSTKDARKKYEAKLKELGATLGSSVTSKTTVLIVGGAEAEKNSKFQDAKKLGIKVEDEPYLIRLMEA